MKTVLHESEPRHILKWCAAARRSPAQAQRMAAPLTRLNYSQMTRDVVDAVEDTLYYAMTGEDRSARFPKDRSSSFLGGEDVS